MSKFPAKARIGVLTFHNGPNFGGFLQAWHLVRAIRSLGYDAHAVNYLHPTHHESNQIRIPMRNLASVKGKIFWFLKKRGFRNIEKKICSDCFTTDVTKVPWKKFDAIVVGSDVVWNYEEEKFGSDPAYFGAVTEMQGIPLVSYAASCGPASVSGPFPSFIREGLSRFHRIGVRDQPTSELVRNASGLDSRMVVDPTWLNPDEDTDWGGLPDRPFLFAYGGSLDASLCAKLRDYCQREGLLLISALSSCPGADKIYRSLTPFQWVQLFKNANSVLVTGTLHGTIYAIKYGRPFILVNAPATSAKISKLLEKIGQSHRLFEPGMVRSQDLLLLNEADDGLVPPRTWVEESRDFLSEALESALCGDSS